MFKVVVGCYEQIVLGYSVAIKEKDNGKSFFLQHEQQFSDHSHLGCIRCVASNNLLVVSGSTDESMSIFNMKMNTDLGPLQGHTGSVNEIVIPESMGNRILSCGDDGNICVWEVGRKKKGLIRMLRGHKGPIDSMAVHPTGKLAMSASKGDGSLRTWNLITGRSAYVKNTKRAQIEFVRWGPSGDYYVTASSRFVQVYDLATAKCVTEWETPQTVLTMKFLPLNHSSKKEFVAIGDGSGYISIHSVPSGSLILRLKAHETRVKDVCGFIPSEIRESSIDECWLATVSSDGKIKIWRFDSKLLSGAMQEPTVKCLHTIDTTARLTCVTVWQGAVSSTQKDESNQVTKGTVSSKFTEKLEITYDENSDALSEESTNISIQSVEKDQKVARNGKVKKKKGNATSLNKKAKLEKLRAELKASLHEEHSEPPKENSIIDSKISVAKKKRKVKFIEIAKVKSVEKSPERGRKRQRKIRTKNLT